MFIDILTTFVLAMTPLVGIRGALPMAIVIHELPIPIAYLASTIGEFIPTFFILAFLGPVSEWLSKHFSFMRVFFNFLFDKTRRDYDGRLQKYGFFALFLFTGIPVPFSGAWTASLVVFLFGLDYWRSVTAIFFGVLLAGVNILLITETGINIEKYFGPQILSGVIALVLFVYFIYYRKKVNSRRNDKSE